MPRKPDIVCIGAQKAGTSWLHEVLGSRSDVWKPPFKELHFFDHKFIPANRTWTKWHVRRGIDLARRREIARPDGPNPDYIEYLDRIEQPPLFNGNWYKSIFERARDDQLCLDVTPEYSCVPLEGVAFIKKFLPATKFIYIIRNPLSRALSQLKMNASRTKEFDNSTAWWRRLAEDDVVLERGLYSDYLPRWKMAFRPEQLLVLPYGMIRRAPEEFLRAIEDHVGLSPGSYDNPSRVVHETKALAVPDEIVDHLRKKIAPQEEFLKRELGDTFFSQT